MPATSLQELYQWARAQLGHPIMFSYVLHKVNGQTPDYVLILLRQPGSKRPNAEIKIKFTPDRVPLYRAVFTFLPFNTKLPYPDPTQVGLGSQQEVIDWLKTGRRRLYFPTSTDDDNLGIPT
jgi:hypothetical protein